MRFSNDGTTWTDWEAYTTSKSWTLPPGDGTKTVYYQIKDIAGLVSITYSDTIVLETTSPSGSITINDGAAYTTTTSVTLTLSATDETSGIAEMRFSDNGADWTPWEAYTTSKPWTLPTGDETKTVYVQFKDHAGLISQSYSDTIVLDTTSPTGSVTIAQGATYTNSTSVTLTLSADDATSGIAYMRFSDDNIDWTIWEPYSTSKTWTLTTGDGAKTIYVQFKDNAGLTSLIYQDTITLDTIKPTADAGVDQTVNEDTLVTFDASASTDENGIASYTWTFTDTTPQTLTGKNPTYTFATPGTYTITLKVTDPAGNTATDTVIITVLDITKPIANAGSDRTVNEDTSITLDGSASSDNIGITAYTWTFTDVTIKTLTGPKPTYTFNTPGVYTITLNVTDAAGNWATDTVVITVLDVTKPVANAGQDQTVNVGTTVTFDAGGSTDNVGVVAYEWDFGDGTTGTGKSATHAYTNPGTYTVTLTVKDAAGNSATDTITVTVLPAEAPPPPPAEAFPMWVVGAVAAIAAIGIAVATILWKRRK
jgi:PKD repeat protein